MKNIKLSTKAVIVGCTMLASIIFCGCQARIENKTMTSEKELFSFGIQTIDHDSCEYILFREPSGGNIQLIHKQNCKYCTKTQP